MRHSKDFKYMLGQFQVCIIREADEGANPPEVNPDNYTGLAESEIAEYIAQDQARLDAWKRDEWYYVVVGVELRLDTATHWAISPIVGKAYLHGIESDSDESYFTEVANELLGEALTDAENTLKALSAAITESRATRDIGGKNK